MWLRYGEGHGVLSVWRSGRRGTQGGTRRDPCHTRWSDLPSNEGWRRVDYALEEERHRRTGLLQGTGEQVCFKLPATQVLDERLAAVPEAPVAIDQPYDGLTYREMWYEERQAVGYLH